MSKQIKALGVIAVAALAMTVSAGTASAAISEFASAKYAATLSGVQTADHVIHTKAGQVKCKSAKFTGTLAAQSKTVSVAPTYPTCALGAAVATVTMNGCTYTLEAGLETAPGKSFGGMAIVCGGKEIVVTVVGGCEIKIPAPAEALGFNTYQNTFAGDFDIKFDIGLFDYTLNNNCPNGPGKFEDGKLTGESTVQGNNGAVGIVP